MRNRLNMLCSSGKNMCRMSVLPILGQQRRSYLENQTSLFLENKFFFTSSSSSSSSHYMEDVLMAALLVEFCCCSPLHPSMRTGFLTLAR